MSNLLWPAGKTELFKLFGESPETDDFIGTANQAISTYLAVVSMNEKSITDKEIQKSL